jgi:hypothetical protein
MDIAEKKQLEGPMITDEDHILATFSAITLLIIL